MNDSLPSPSATYLFFFSPTRTNLIISLHKLQKKKNKEKLVTWNQIEEFQNFRVEQSKLKVREILLLPNFETTRECSFTNYYLICYFVNFKSPIVYNREYFMRGKEIFALILITHKVPSYLPLPDILRGYSRKLLSTPNLTICNCEFTLNAQQLLLFFSIFLY